MTTIEKLNKLEEITQEQQEIGKDKLQQQGRILPIGDTIEDVMDNIPTEDDYYTKNEVNYLINQTKDLIPDKVSELENDAGYTNNEGTVTAVKVGDTTYQPTDGIVELPESSGGAQIDDEHVSSTTTYSSQKIEAIKRLGDILFDGTLTGPTVKVYIPYNDYDGFIFGMYQHDSVVYCAYALAYMPKEKIKSDNTGHDYYFSDINRSNPMVLKVNIKNITESDSFQMYGTTASYTKECIVVGVKLNNITGD